MAYGLLSTGFVPKPQTVIEDEIKADLRTAFGSSIRFDSKSVFGQFVATQAERYALLWELAEAVNASQNPDAATGARLDDICALTGTIREAAYSSTVNAWLCGTPTTAIAVGSQASTLSTDILFKTINAETIAAATAWAGSTAYVVGDIRTNAGRMYYCITAGTSAGSGGPTTTADDITDNTAHWQYMGEGTGWVTAAMESVTAGPYLALAGDLTVIETPISGWDTVKNQLDAVAGDNLETDSDLRIRREDELAAAGTGTLDAMRADILDVSGVQTCKIFVNDTDTTDGDGLPPHSFECLVDGTQTDQDVFDTILANKPIGIQTYGTTSGSATDSQGTTYTIKFTKPTQITIWVDVTLIYDATLYPVDGDAQVEAAILAYGATYTPGKDVHDTALIAQCFQIPGVLDVTALVVGTADPPAAGVVTIADREIAAFDSARTDIISSAA